MLYWLCLWLVRIYMSNNMVGLVVDRASQWTVDRRASIAKEVSPVEGGIGWHSMEGLVWTGGGAQMRRIRTKSERVGVSAGDQENKVAIFRETDQRLVLGRPGKENTLRIEEGYRWRCYSCSASGR